MMRALETALRTSDIWYPRRGDVCWVRLDKRRPAVILSINELNRHALDVCVVPITTEHHGQFPMRVPIEKGDGGLPAECWAKCDQPTTIEKIRVDSRLGTLSADAFRKIQEKVSISLGLTRIL